MSKVNKMKLIKEVGGGGRAFSFGESERKMLMGRRETAKAACRGQLCQETHRLVEKKSVWSFVPSVLLQQGA